MAGNHWIQTVPAAHGLAALVVSSPGEPREVARLTLDRPDWPHGASGPADPHGAVFSGPTDRSDG